MNEISIRPHKYPFLFIAHRGFRIGVMENSLSAFHLAIQQQMDYIELDIHTSKDGMIYVIHDEKLDRTTDGRGSLRKKSHFDLQKIHIKGQAEHIPTLRDVIALIKTTTTRTRLMIELKAAGIEECLVPLLHEFHVENQVCISGRNLQQFLRFHTSIPTIPLCLNITHCPDFPLKRFLSISREENLPIPFIMISLRASEITSEFIQKCHSFNISALAWDFIHDSRCVDTMKALIQKGIDGCLFDDPMTVLPIRSYLNEIRK